MDLGVQIIRPIDPSMKTFTPEEYAKALGNLSPEARAMILEDETGMPSINDVGLECGLSEEQIPVFVKICVPTMYGLVTVADMQKLLVEELSIKKDHAERISERCKETFLKPVSEQFGNTQTSTAADEEQPETQDDGMEKLRKEMVAKIRGHAVGAGNAKALSALEGRVHGNAHDVDQFKFETEETRVFGELLSMLSEPVKKVIVEGVYKNAVKGASVDFGLDDEAMAGIQMEVLVFLMGLQSRSELQRVLEQHQSLTEVQGAEVMKGLEKTLFAPLAEYLPGNSEEGEGAGSITLLASITENTAAAERMGKLPSGVQEVIKGDDLQRSFTTLIRKHNLSVDVARSLAQHVSVVLVGLGTTNDFKVNVTKDTGLEPSKLESVFQDIEVSLFKPVRTAILTALEQKKTDATPPPTPTTDPYRTDAS